MIETIILVVVLAVVAAACFYFKNDNAKVAPVMVVSAIAASLIAGMGIRMREMVEGPFAYLDTIMAVLVAAIFVMLLSDNGTFDFILQKIFSVKRSALTQMVLLMLLVAIPGIMTGTMSAGIVTTGIIVGKFMLKNGVNKTKTIEFIAVSCFIGMLLPPLSLPAMIMITGRIGSYPATYNGVGLTLLVMGVVVFLAYALTSAKRIMGGVEFKIAKAEVGGIKCIIPIVVVLLLTISNDFLPGIVPFLGYPLIFTIGAALAILLPCHKFKAMDSAVNGVGSVAGILALFVGIGSLYEVLVMTGVTGYFATITATWNVTMLILGMFVLVILAGLFLGGGTASVLAVVATYFAACLEYGGGKDTILYVAISGILGIAFLICFRGGIIKKTAVAIAGENENPDTKEIIKGAIIPILVTIAVCVLFTAAYNSLTFLII